MDVQSLRVGTCTDTANEHNDTRSQQLNHLEIVMIQFSCEAA